jgi:hypothetical protein
MLIETGTGGLNLFWKKKKQPIDTQDPLEAEDQREAFRYIFKEDLGFSMDFKQKPVQVINISAGGMAFRNEGFTRYDVDQITLVLDIPNYRGETFFSAQLRILDISEQGICHCIFENCTIQKYEIIHKYVLEMQKKEMITKFRKQMIRKQMTRK